MFECITLDEPDVEHVRRFVTTIIVQSNELFGVTFRRAFAQVRTMPFTGTVTNTSDYTFQTLYNSYFKGH
jgi:hypothetical protein